MALFSLVLTVGKEAYLAVELNMNVGIIYCIGRETGKDTSDSCELFY